MFTSSITSADHSGGNGASTVRGLASGSRDDGDVDVAENVGDATALGGGAPSRNSGHSSSGGCRTRSWQGDGGDGSAESQSLGQCQHSDIIVGGGRVVLRVHGVSERAGLLSAIVSAQIVFTGNNAQVTSRSSTYIRNQFKLLKDRL